MLVHRRRQARHGVRRDSAHARHVCPTVLHRHQLSRLATYLNKFPEAKWVYAYQAMPSDIRIEVDADWAGDEVGRRSTDGGFELFGSCLLDAWATTQQTVALSSGESELYAMCNGSARGIWTRELLKECGHTLQVAVETDSSAAKGIASRLGAGRIRHLEARFLWIQERTRYRTIVVRKVAGVDNRADITTKLLDGPRFFSLLALLPIRIRVRCSAEGAPAAGVQRIGAAVAAIILLPAVVAERLAVDLSCQPHADDDSDNTSGYPTLFIMSVFGSLVAYVSFRAGRASGKSTRALETGTQTQNDSENTAVQTDALRVRRYWAESRHEVVLEAQRRGIPGATRARASRSDLSGDLVDHDLNYLL